MNSYAKLLTEIAQEVRAFAAIFRSLVVEFGLPPNTLTEETLP